MNAPRDLQHDFFDMLMESQFWSPAQITAYQRGELEQLLRHAKANVPFYETRLDCVFDRHGNIDWDRWHEIPIVKRSDMRDHRDAMLARQVPDGHGQSSTISSSGSSGLPVQITSNRLVMVAANANRWRAHRWHGFDWSKTQAARIKRDGTEWPSGKAAGPWGPPWDETARKGQLIMISRTTSPEQMLEFIGRTGARYLTAGPKVAHSYALEAERSGISVKFDGLLAHGERVGDDDREVIRRVFGASILEHYSSKEGAQMAYPCPHGRGLHINAESVLVEVVDSDGFPVPPRTPGRVVITPFVSTAQPLIRYDQGDIATMAEGCTCGRGLPTLGRVDGRQSAMFRHPDGRTRGLLFGTENRDALGCTFWQIAQVGPNVYEIRYVPDDWDKPADEETVVAAFRKTYFEDAEVRFVRKHEIALTDAGKYLEYVNEWLGDGKA